MNLASAWWCSRLSCTTAALFPLTPTLSLRERENHWQVVYQWPSRSTVGRRTWRPLPEGEGWGEGERRVRRHYGLLQQQWAELVLNASVHWQALICTFLKSEPPHVGCHNLFPVAEPAASQPAAHADFAGG